MKVQHSKLQRGWSCITSHRVPTFLCKQTWPHFGQTLGEQTQTALCLAGQRVLPLHVWQERGTKTKGGGGAAAFHINDVHIWSAANYVISLSK